MITSSKKCPNVNASAVVREIRLVVRCLMLCLRCDVFCNGMVAANLRGAWDLAVRYGFVIPDGRLNWCRRSLSLSERGSLEVDLRSHWDVTAINDRVGWVELEQEYGASPAA